MTGGVVARIRWRALDRDGRDSCRLVEHEAGWMLIGHARFREAEGDSALDYVVRCDPEWTTLSADVSGIWRGAQAALRVERTGETWLLNGEAVTGVTGAVDIDLGFTPATNLMPLRRLSEIGSLDATAAWLADPGAGLARLDQRYTRRRGGVVHYMAEQTGYETDLVVAPCGFVTTYPGAWEATDAP